MQGKQEHAQSVPVILTPEEVAQMLRVELSFVYEKSRRRQRNPIPVHRIGRYLRYYRAEVIAWFDGQAQPTRKGAARA
jgi:excisionase family DNA binding protein